MLSNREEIITAIKDKLGKRLLRFTEKNTRRYFIEVEPADVPDAVYLLFRDLNARFQIASGVDTPTGIEILYHFAFDDHNFLVSVRTRLDRNQPQIESVASICVAAEWIEREMWELLGITFLNHPDMRHLLLSDDWPEGKYPLRRDYQKDD